MEESEAEGPTSQAAKKEKTLGLTKKNVNYDEYLMAMKRVHRRQSMRTSLLPEMRSPRERHRRENNINDIGIKSVPGNWSSVQEADRIGTIASMVPDEIIYNHYDHTVRSYETALMFIDVSGFTDLCEKYTKAGRGGPSRLSQVLNSYIGAMVQEILTYNGDVLKFSGDAFISMWKKTARLSMHDCIHTAIDCGLVIQKNYGTHVTDIGVVLKVKISISAGVSFFSIIGGGDNSQASFVIVGQPVWDVKKAEVSCKAGEVLTSASAWNYIHESWYCTQPCNDGHVKVLGVGATWKRVKTLSSFLAMPQADHTQTGPETDSTLNEINIDETNLELHFREFSLRPAVVTAMRSSWWPGLRRYMLAPVLRAVENDEPMDFLTEVRRVVVVFLNIITKTVTPDVLINVVDGAYKCVSSVTANSGGLVNKVSMFDKDMMFLVVFGLRGLKHEDEAQKALQCAFQLKTSLDDDHIKGVSIGVTSVSDASEEVKYSTVRCLTVLMLNIPHEFRVKLLKNQVPMLAQAVFVSVHIAKLERLRVLRLAAIQCVTAHTMTHPQLTVEYRMPNAELELLAVDNMLSSILPGVLAALQDVCACTDNPTHAVVAAAIEAIHRILCIPMHDKYLDKKPITTGDFVTILTEKKAKCDTEVSNKAQKSPKDMAKRSEEWFAMAGEKLTLITKSLISLRVYEHFKVRKELAIFCYRILTECSTTMPASIPLCLDVLISLSRDEYPEVSSYCSTAVTNYFANAPEHARSKTMDCLCDNFISLLISLPRILNNIDESRKMSVLNLLHGYIVALMSSQPQRLTGALSVAAHMQHLCTALAAAARHDTRLATHVSRRPLDVSSPPPLNSPWSSFQHLDSVACITRLQEVCVLLGGAECAELVLDVLLDRFQSERECEPIYILNWMISSPESTESMARRIIYAYLDQDTWYQPLEVGSGESPLTNEDTFDISVYNPRAWTKDSVPDLYEGTVETRYTDITYREPRRSRHDPRYCGSLAEAQKNLVLCCLLTEGIGVVASRMRNEFDIYLLKTLCSIMERVGSEYEFLHLAGLKCLNMVAQACGHATVGQLICMNADYFTSQVTSRLKKAWNCQSALRILAVVMEYSSSNIANSLYGIVTDVLVQSCDKYYESELHAYLEAFLACVQCIRKWYPPQAREPDGPGAPAMDLLEEVREYVKDTQEAERLLSDSDFEKTSGKTVEEMYKEDMKQKEDDLLDSHDTVTNEETPLPRHILVTIKILKRCLHFITSPNRDEAILALQTLNQGFPILVPHEDELLPLVHLCWAPLVARFQCKEPVVLRRAFDLLVTLAALSKDFIHIRTVKEVLPEVYKFLLTSSKDSYLKDVGSAYRSSQAYTLQLAALDTLPSLAVDLGLADDRLTEAMTCVQVYLSNKQPKPLQASAVKFFKTILEYEYPLAWYHLRQFCDNDEVLEPPAVKHMALEPVPGTPYKHKHKEYDGNIQLIFDFMVS